MSIVQKTKDLEYLKKENTDSKDSIWTIETHIKNTIVDYKAYLNRGITESALDEKIFALYRQVIKGRIILNDLIIKIKGELQNVDRKEIPPEKHDFFLEKISANFRKDH